MRVLMKVQIPTEAGNAAIKDGSLPQIVGKALDALKAEAAYFTSEEGMRTALISSTWLIQVGYRRRRSRSL